MNEAERTYVINLVESFVGDRESAEIWYNSFNKKLACTPSEAPFEVVLGYLSRFMEISFE